MEFLFPLSEWPQQHETGRRAWQHRMTRVLINQAVTFCMQSFFKHFNDNQCWRVLSHFIKRKDNTEGCKDRETSTKVTAASSPHFLDFSPSHTRINPAATNRKRMVVLSLLFWNVILTFLTQLLTVRILNMYKYLVLKNILVVIDHCNLHKLLGQWTESRTEWLCSFATW